MAKRVLLLTRADSKYRRDAKGVRGKTEDCTEPSSQRLHATLTKLGVHCDLMYWEDAHTDQILRLAPTYDFTWCRLASSECVWSELERLLQGLAEAGLPHAPRLKDINTLGTKGVVFALRDTELGAKGGTIMFRDVDAENKEQLAEVAAQVTARIKEQGRRVLKREHGAACNGVWALQLAGDDGDKWEVTFAQDGVKSVVQPTQFLHTVVATAASSNLIDMPFLAELSKIGETRFYFSGNRRLKTPVMVKRPGSEDHFTVTKLLGGTRTLIPCPSPEEVDKWPMLVATAMKLPHNDLPLFWCTDGVAVVSPDSGALVDGFTLSEINCSNVGLCPFLEMKCDFEVEGDMYVELCKALLLRMQK